MWAFLLAVLATVVPGGNLLMANKLGPPASQSRCRYITAYGLKSVECKMMNAVGVPQRLDTDIQVLDLTFNRIRDIYNTSFENYPYLKYLYLEDNSISCVEAGAFSPITDLEVLDMTWNSLHTVPEGLHSLPVLRKLSLAKNPFSTVHFFYPLPSVEILDLSECRLRDFPSLEALPRLLTLNVSSNRIKSVNIHQIAPLCRLRELDLRGNKQLFARPDDYCECNLFSKWALMRGIKTHPPASSICERAYRALPKPFDNSSCFSNETELIFEESRLVLRSCEAEVQEYGSGPIRIRASVIWTLGAVGSCVVLFVCILSVYFVKRRQEPRRLDEVDRSEEQLTKSRT